MLNKASFSKGKAQKPAIFFFGCKNGQNLHSFAGF
jgi:hypothetical protein